MLAPIDLAGGLFSRLIIFEEGGAPPPPPPQKAICRLCLSF